WLFAASLDIPTQQPFARIQEDLSSLCPGCFVPGRQPRLVVGHPPAVFTKEPASDEVNLLDKEPPGNSASQDEPEQQPGAWRVERPKSERQKEHENSANCRNGQNSQPHGHRARHRRQQASEVTER